MTVYVVVIERNTESVDGEMVWIDGVYADATIARRAKWAAMRQQIEQGQRVYGRRTEDDWDVDVHANAFDVIEVETINQVKDQQP